MLGLDIYDETMTNSPLYRMSLFLLWRVKKFYLQIMLGCEAKWIRGEATEDVEIFNNHGGIRLLTFFASSNDTQ